jgi:acetylornithine/LysW-gamma-L-lysine aminotransferase
VNITATENAFTSGFYAKRPLAIVRGEGCHVEDADGRRYLDCVAGIGVANVGHCHPAIVRAISEQAQTLITCPELFYNDRRAALLAALAARLPGDLKQIFLCNSGTEAVEAALKLARLSTGRSEVVALMRGFHGRTFGALSATHKPDYRRPFEPLVPGFRHIAAGNLAQMQAAITPQTAAVLVEVVQGEGGVRPVSADWLHALHARCQAQGALLIVDEIQTGFGRTGHWFACDGIGLVPDILCMGKGIAGGVPMGAMAFGGRVGGVTPGVHGSTFGGNPLACAAALAALTVYEEEGLIARSAETGARFRQQVRDLRSPLIREVRGAGLMIGVELRVRATPVLHALAENGVLALLAGPTVLRFLPPLIIGRNDIDQIVTALGKALESVSLPEAAPMAAPEVARE